MKQILEHQFRRFFFAIQLNLYTKSLHYFCRISFNFLVKHIMNVSYLVVTTTRPSRQSAIILVSIDNFLSQSLHNGLKCIFQKVWDRMPNTATKKCSRLSLPDYTKADGSFIFLEKCPLSAAFLENEICNAYIQSNLFQPLLSFLLSRFKNSLDCNIFLLSLKASK